jgi:hypothetical protein
VTHVYCTRYTHIPRSSVFWSNSEQSEMNFPFCIHTYTYIHQKVLLDATRRDSTRLDATRCNLTQLDATRCDSSDGTPCIFLLNKYDKRFFWVANWRHFTVKKSFSALVKQFWYLTEKTGVKKEMTPSQVIYMSYKRHALRTTHLTTNNLFDKNYFFDKKLLFWQ